MSTPQEIKLPGFGLPISYAGAHFPVVLGMEEGEGEGDWRASTLTIREVCMIKVIEDLTNKPEWWIKVNDDEITAKWKKEAMEMPWGEYRVYGDFTHAMADACIKELRKKADIYQKTGLIPVMDYASAAIKSDNLVPKDLRDALVAAVSPLENVPEEHKDWHPGSDGKVLDIVHPSLWPLVYGRSLILPDKRINLEEALSHCGKGVVVPVDNSDDTMWPSSAFSKRFQWLPCDVDLTGVHPRIDSYINNVHPAKHAELYPVIEKFIEKSLPAWDNRPLDDDEAPRREDEDYEEDYEESDRNKRDEEWFRETHVPELPDPKTELEELVKISPSDVKTSGFFGNASRVQVIVKLANIHLTPEKPTYDGGSWHVEGQLNEHICATALYYYDCDNITDSRLDFRTAANREDQTVELNYEQGDFDSIERVFAIDPGADLLQNIGSVLTRQDRMLFFPNVYQHHVSPFELVDKSRPGHRKILALFLVDPQVPIISTANVPPQQRNWWAEGLLKNDRFNNLPPELTRMVVDNLDFPIDLEDAKKIREELMAERTNLQDTLNSDLKNLEWNFCEH
ncbi:hypothetical protein FOC1_g10008106 [Fusarium oxysporum f. sp. cubense race 1]|uniref:Uncharacterized protein n=1 Tax=Fusarium oxysporum f. sp. cubense (strain race 1) TaxID=1229664 RepID=N4U820_FUSC1|nr:hypothetical protein FOC1_g10008106 [Fusarium oxysporum f. sp. cubense race 1]